LKFLLSIFSLAFALHNVLIILLSCRKRKGEAGTSKQPATKKSKKGGAKKGGAKKGATASTSTYFDHIEKGCTEPPSELDAELPPSLPAKSKSAETPFNFVTMNSLYGCIMTRVNCCCVGRGKERLLHQHLRSLPKSPKKMAHQAP